MTGCVSPQPEPRRVVVTLRFCTSWDFVDWDALVAPRLTAALRRAPHPVRRVRAWWWWRS